MLMTVHCQEPGCKRSANVIFTSGEKREVCEACGVEHTERVQYSFCYEHGYLFLKNKHDNARYIEL